MKPPICAVRGRGAGDAPPAPKGPRWLRWLRKPSPPIDDGAAFDTVNFADFQPLPQGVCGHPAGMEWFCPRHLAKARRLSHLLTAEAVRLIRSHEPH